jgi:hypothetical protein
MQVNCYTQVCQSVSLSVCQSVSLSVCQSVSLSVCQSVSLSVVSLSVDRQIMKQAANVDQVLFAIQQSCLITTLANCSKNLFAHPTPFLIFPVPAAVPRLKPVTLG